VTWPIATDDEQIKYLEVNANGTLTVPDEDFMPKDKIKLWKSITDKIEELTKEGWEKNWPRFHKKDEL